MTRSNGFIAGTLAITMAACTGSQPSPEKAKTDAPNDAQRQIIAAEQVVARSSAGKVVVLELPLISNEAGLLPECNDAKPAEANARPEDVSYCSAAFEIAQAQKLADQKYQQTVEAPAEEKIAADYEAAQLAAREAYAKDDDYPKKRDADIASYRVKRDAELEVYRAKSAHEVDTFRASNQALAGIQRIYLSNGLTVRFEIK